MQRYGMVEGMSGWEYVRTIGSGSFGTVYEVKKCGFEDTPSSALKVITIPRDTAELNAINYLNEDGVRKYFESYKNEVLAEIRLMADLKGNSHIVSLEDYTEIEHKDEIGWDILIRMELLQTVDKYIGNKSFSENELTEFVLKIGLDVCQALMLCHERNIIHRDIKPANIFINQNGDFKLGDFGIARTMERTMSMMSQKGSPAYMAPEVFHGKEYDQSCDIYSLGMTLYRFLNQYRLPFEPLEGLAPADVETAQRKRLCGERIPEPIHGTKELKAVIKRAVEYNPMDRYRTAREFYEALLSCDDTSIIPPAPPKKMPWKVIFGGLIAAVVLLVIAIVMSLLDDHNISAVPETSIASEISTKQVDTQETEKASILQTAENELQKETVLPVLSADEMIRDYLDKTNPDQISICYLDTNGEEHTIVRGNVSSRAVEVGRIFVVEYALRLVDSGELEDNDDLRDLMLGCVTNELKPPHELISMFAENEDFADGLDILCEYVESMGYKDTILNQFNEDKGHHKEKRNNTTTSRDIALSMKKICDMADDGNKLASWFLRELTSSELTSKDGICSVIRKSDDFSSISNIYAANDKYDFMNDVALVKESDTGKNMIIAIMMQNDWDEEKKADVMHDLTQIIWESR